MSEPSKDDLILYRISRARETLDEVQSMIDGEHWNAAVNRLYYACFYSVSAILLKYNINAQTHGGVRQMFGLHLIQTGKISRELGKFYADLFDKRQTGDYDDFILYDKQTVDDLFPKAIELVDKIEAIIKMEK